MAECQENFDLRGLGKVGSLMMNVRLGARRVEELLGDGTDGFNNVSLARLQAIDEQLARITDNADDARILIDYCPPRPSCGG